MSEASEPSDNSMNSIVRVVRLSRSAILGDDGSGLLSLLCELSFCIFALLSGVEYSTRRWTEILVCRSSACCCVCVGVGCDSCRLQFTRSFSRALYAYAGTVIAANTALRQTTRATVALSDEWEKVDLHVRVRSIG